MVQDATDVYRALQKHLDSMPVGFPPTESGVEIRILKQLFTPEEARIAAYLTYSTHPSESLDDIHGRVEQIIPSREELEETLDGMVRKGLIIFKREEGTKFYNNAQWVVGIYEFQVNKMTPELYNDIIDYNLEAFGRVLHKTPLPQLRVIPVEKSIEHQHEVASYDMVRELVNSSSGPFMVANCVCREAMDLMDNPCKATDRRETCIGAGPLAQMYIDQGWGREVNQEELLGIIEENQKDGLVLQPSNSKELEFLCSCCGCCCGILFGTKMARRPVKFFATNYFAEVDREICTECGTCTDLCQMEALTLGDEGLSINLDRCIGCGVCVANCDFDALSLKKREEEKIPPESVDELYSILLEKKGLQK